MEFSGNYILELFYLIASIFFIVGLRMLTDKETAHKGNISIAIGMLTAVLSTIFLFEIENETITNLYLIFPAIIVGGVVGWLYVLKGKNEAMPQLVSILNGLGGLAIILVSIIEFPKIDSYFVENYGMANSYVLPVIIALIAGGISFSGSISALWKLESTAEDKNIPLVRFLNFAILIAIIGFSVYILTLGKEREPRDILHLVFILFFLSVCYGFTLVFPALKKDAPLIIAFLNTFTGVGVTMLGFFYSNLMMIAGGILVGSVSIVLTLKMCKAMDRSFINLIIGELTGQRTSKEEKVT